MQSRQKIRFGAYSLDLMEDGGLRGTTVGKMIGMDDAPPTSSSHGFEFVMREVYHRSCVVYVLIPEDLPTLE